MPDPDNPPGLDAYLRLNRASSCEWPRALRRVLGSETLQCHGERSQTTFGSLSALHTRAGVICVIHAAQPLSLADDGLPAPMLVMPVLGDCRLQLANGRPGCALPVGRISAQQRFALEFEAGSRVLLAYPLSSRQAVDSAVASSQALSGALCRFLRRADYFRDHQHACVEACELFAELAQVRETPAVEGPDSMPAIDRRVARAVEKIRDEPRWVFNLRDLASHAGVSERNLYYLMKRQTGLTPYRFYQRCRLVRVRRQLVDCQCDIPHVSWYAADEGFSHLGRFAALYRQHFGELPSETVLWRRQLQDGCSSAYSSAAEPW